MLDTTKINVKKYPIEDYINASGFLVQFLIEHLLIPGKIENWINIIDMGKQGLTQLPLKAILKYVSALQKLYKCRLAYSFVVNPPSSIVYIWTCCKPFIDKATQSKVVIEKNNYSDLMLSIFEPDQLEEKFGGKC